LSRLAWCLAERDSSLGVGTQALGQALLCAAFGPSCLQFRHPLTVTVAATNAQVPTNHRRARGSSAVMRGFVGEVLG
jgi:hypothetical protein